LLPAGLTFVSATPSQGAYVRGTEGGAEGTSASGGSAPLQVVETVSGVGPYVNIAEVIASDQPDPDSTPNNGNPAEDDQASATPSPLVADLSVAKTVSSGTPNVGSNVTFNVTVSNAGPDTATNVRVSDPLPAGLTFVSATPSQGAYV